MVSHPPPTAETWAHAATGRDGYYRHRTPEQGFATSTSSSAATSGLLAEAVAGVLAEHPGIGAVLDVGAGSGRLLAGLGALRPDLRLTAVDLRPRPGELAAEVGWLVDRYDHARAGWTSGALGRWWTRLDQPALVLATELLDDVPLSDLASSVATGAGSGAERWATRRWVRRWWPDGDPEVGLHRDACWSGLVRGLRRQGGLALMVDYGHVRAARPDTSTLASYRAGRRVPVAASADRNLTAHVAVDAVADAGERAGARTLALLRQSAALSRWSPDAATGARPRGLDVLVRRGALHALTRTGGLGEHWWLLQRVAGRPC